MDNRIRHEHIAAEANRVRNILNRNDNTANWYEAIDNLNIFPNNTYDVSHATDTVALHLLDAQANFGIVYGYNGHQFRIGWYHCRESFEKDIKAIYRSSYYVKYDRCHYCFLFRPTHRQEEHRMANLIRNIELDRLNLGELSTFMRVRNKPYICVRPSSFWTSCEMRFSLYTLLIRAGNEYFYNTIEDALYKNSYGRLTMGAIKAFFNGRRNYTGGSLNWRYKWVSQYSHLSENQITTLSY